MRKIIEIIFNCPLCEKEIIIDKVIDHCHLTGKCRGPAHQSCVTQRQSNFILNKIDIFTNFDCHLFFKNFAD